MTSSTAPAGSGSEEACSYALIAALRWYSFEASLWLIEQVPDDPGPRQGLRDRAIVAMGIAQEGRNLATNPALISALDRLMSAYGLIADVALTGTPEQIAAAIASPQLHSALTDIEAACP